MFAFSTRTYTTSLKATELLYAIGLLIFTKGSLVFAPVKVVKYVNVSVAKFEDICALFTVKLKAAIPSVLSSHCFKVIGVVTIGKA